MDLKSLEQNLKSLTDNFKSELQSMRGSRPSPKMVEDIRVDYYGQPTPVKQLGSISVVLPREINISVWDKNAVNAVAKAIEESNLKVTANIDGNLIRINLPPLTEERKIELEKVIRKVAEETRIKVRTAREGVNKEIKKMEDEKKLSEDAAFKKKEEVQKLVDKVNKEIEAILDNKLKELFE